MLPGFYLFEVEAEEEGEGRRSQTGGHIGEGPGERRPGPDAALAKVREQTQEEEGSAS